MALTGGTWYKELKEGYNFWWVAPVYSQSEIAFNRLRRKVEKIPGFDINKSKLSITTPIGTIIHFKTAKDPNNLYGEDVYGAVFDEFTRSTKDAWFALRSTLTATKAPCKLIGNYTGSLNWGTKLAEKANEDNLYSYYKITAYDAVREGILEEEEVNQAKKDLPKPVFDALYLAKGSGDSGQLFNPSQLSDITKVKAQAGRNYLSCDIASYGSDKFVLVAWNGWRILKVYSFSKMGPDEIEAKIREIAKKHIVRTKDIIYDADGIGYFLKGYLKKAVPFHNGGKPYSKENYLNLKTQCYYELAKRINEGQIELADTEYYDEILTELEVIQRDDRKDGKLRIIDKKDMKEILGYSPDFADAIMMRVWFDISQTIPKM